MRISDWSSDVCSSDLVDVDRALAARDFEGALHLFDRAVYGIGDQFLMPVATGAAMIDLGNDVAEAVIAVRIDRRHRADAAGRRPGAGTGDRKSTRLNSSH